MHAASVVLIATALLSTCMWAILLGQLWILRREFKIAARAPVLVGVCGWSTLVVLSALFLHWILLVDGKGIPCFVMCLMTYLCEFTYLLYFCLGSLARRVRVFRDTQYNSSSLYFPRNSHERAFGSTMIEHKPLVRVCIQYTY